MTTQKLSTVPLNWKEVWYTNCLLVSASNVDQELGWTREEFKKIGVKFAFMRDAERGSHDARGGEEVPPARDPHERRRLFAGTHPQGAGERFLDRADAHVAHLRPTKKARVTWSRSRSARTSC
jgi:hypothetical protein